MDEPRYSNRQIERMLDQQSTDLKKHIDDATGPILVQTTKTNGRVDALEKETGRIWKGLLALGILVLGIVLGRPELIQLIVAAL